MGCRALKTIFMTPCQAQHLHVGPIYISNGVPLHLKISSSCLPLFTVLKLNSKIYYLLIIFIQVIKD